MKLHAKLKSLLIALFLIIININLYSQCTNCAGAISSPEQVSSAIGERTKASGFASFASGSFVIASGDYSTGLGSWSHAVGKHSITIGSNATSISNQSMVIGQGYGHDSEDQLFNRKANSLVIGFNSIYPTLFVSKSNDRTSTGRIGIGNVTEPQAKLHIRPDPDEAAIIFLEQNSNKEAEIWLGDPLHGIKAELDRGLIFMTDRNYIFNEGRIGIGTSYPEDALDVNGCARTRAFTLFDKEMYQEDITGWVLRSDAGGKAFWTDPASLNDNDWVIDGENIYRREGNVGIGTPNPLAQLDLADVYPAGGMNLKLGNDAYLTDVDRSHTLGIFSQSEPLEGGIMLGGAGPLLHGTNGRLGLGTREPSTTLEINHSLNTGGTIGLSLANEDHFKWFFGMNGDGGDVNNLLIGDITELNNGPSSFLVIRPNGNIGLGTNETYGYKLAVDGAILTEEVTVKLSQEWPDYVFSETYKLQSLHEVNEFISLNGHLPGIPGAEYIQDNGMQLGEMGRLLLEKVEELTLYIIEQENRIAGMEEKLNKMEKH